MNAKDLKEQINRGKAVYSANCMACHQASGKGMPNVFPPLAASDYLNKDPKRAISAVKYGIKGPIVVNGQNFNGVMPKVAISDEQIADVLTFIYNTWNNKKQEVTTKQVAKVKN